MNKVLDFFKQNTDNKVLSKQIRVYGWQFEFDHLLTTSVSKYLFEDFKVIENIAPLNDVNRPGNIKKKHYVTVHDTGDTSSLHTAGFWSKTVFDHCWEQKPNEFVHYACSFQYVTGNDGIYHNIPDNEVAYHAGDGTKFDYKLYPTKVKVTEGKPIVTISEDGYYEINGEKTEIAAPRAYYERNGKVLIDRISKTSDINDEGILCVPVDGVYCLGETYFSQGYNLIANRGGNNNSIGIESCIDEGTDIYYTWQRTAKLVAHLLRDNDLTIEAVKQHHYFSGKNCPQTMRMNGMWEHFKELVKFELKVLEFLDEGYQINLICDDNRVDEKGRIILNDDTSPIKYRIQTVKDNDIEYLDFEIEVA